MIKLIPNLKSIIHAKINKNGCGRWRIQIMKEDGEGREKSS